MVSYCSCGLITLATFILAYISLPYDKLATICFLQFLFSIHPWMSFYPEEILELQWASFFFLISNWIYKHQDEHEISQLSWNVWVTLILQLYVSKKLFCDTIRVLLFFSYLHEKLLLLQLLTVLINYSNQVADLELCHAPFNPHSVSTTAIVISQSSQLVLNILTRTLGAAISRQHIWVGARQQWTPLHQTLNIPIL